MRNMKTREGYEYWDKLCAIPNHAFLFSSDGKRIVATPGMGNWIDQHAAQEVMDAAQDEINALRAEVAALQSSRDADTGMTITADDVKQPYVILGNDDFPSVVQATLDKHIACARELEAVKHQYRNYRNTIREMLMSGELVYTGGKGDDNERN